METNGYKCHNHPENHPFYGWDFNHPHMVGLWRWVYHIMGKNKGLRVNDDNTWLHYEWFFNVFHVKSCVDNC
jgi:hypothetical protein